MNTLEFFAQNLRKTVAKHESIAAVCRATGINRQQFNKYLAAQSMPTPTTLRKICTALGVSEADLIGARPFPKAEALTSSRRISNRTWDHLEKLVRPAPSAGEHPIESVFIPGLYHLYAATAGPEQAVLRSLIVLQGRLGRLSFTRLSRFSSAARWLGTARGKHNGIVVTSMDDESFVGRNVNPPYQFTVITLERWKTLREFHTGLMLTRSTSQIVCSRVAMHKLDARTNIRTAIRSLGMLPRNDASVPAIIDTLLFYDIQKKDGIIASPTQDVLMPALAGLMKSS